MASSASAAELKAAYRALVKQHHPDAGGDEHRILELNAAWEVLGDPDRRAEHDRLHSTAVRSSRAARKATARAARGDAELLAWLQQVYGPIDRLLAQVINPFPAQLRALSADSERIRTRLVHTAQELIKGGAGPHLPAHAPSSLPKPISAAFLASLGRGPIARLLSADVGTEFRSQSGQQRVTR